MAQYITRIRTSSGDLQIDYQALANLPESDTTLTNEGSFADAKATGDAINQLSAALSDTNLNLVETKTIAENGAISIDELKKVTSLLNSSSDSTLDISSNNGAYHFTVDDDGISFWYYTTKVAYIQNDTLYAINTKVEQNFTVADFMVTVENGYLVWS